MQELRKKLHSNPHLVYALFSTLLIVLYWATMILTRSNLIHTYYVNDYTDTYMDYYNMLATMYDSSHPYLHDANYPAMPFLIWRALYHMVPLSSDASDGFFLRNYLPATLGFILYSTFVLLAIYQTLNSLVKTGRISKPLLSMCLMLGGPFIFALERGNMILLSFLFSLLFFRLYNAPKKGTRCLGYLCLALAASIKIYPALFGLLIIKRKRISEIVFAIATGVFTFVLPFFCFEGVKSIRDFLSGILYANTLQGDSGMGYNFSLKNLLKIVSSLCGHDLTEYYKPIFVICMLLCLFVTVFAKPLWQKTFSIVLMILWIPEFSYTYVLIFLCIPLIQFLNECKMMNGSIVNVCIGICFMVTQVPLALPSLQQLDITNARLPLTYPTLIINSAIVVLSILVCADTIFYVCKRKSNINRKDQNNE